jgi:hypothetical protein
MSTAPRLGSSPRQSCFSGHALVGGLEDDNFAGRVVRAFCDKSMAAANRHRGHVH